MLNSLFKKSGHQLTKNAAVAAAARKSGAQICDMAQLSDFYSIPYHTLVILHISMAGLRVGGHLPSVWVWWKLRDLD